MALTQVNLANMVTGVLPVANGGTGSSSALVPSGTAMLFKQTASPTGWTKVTTDNDAALRVVSGTASTGGTVAFTTAFASQAVSGTVGTSGSTTDTGTVGNTTLTTSTMPSHTHVQYIDASYNPAAGGAGGRYAQNNTGGSASPGGLSTGSNGSSGAHNHSLTMNAHTHTGGTFTGTAINLAVKYVDVIIATKD